MSIQKFKYLIVKRSMHKGIIAIKEWKKGLYLQIFKFDFITQKNKHKNKKLKNTKLHSSNF